jgi:hypothetical protein
MASSVNTPLRMTTDNNHLFFVVKHTLGCGTLAGIYAAQVSHIYEVVGFSPVSMVYLFALLAFYFILYGYEAKFIVFVQDSYIRRLKFFEISVLVLNVLLSVNEYMAQIGGRYANPTLEALAGVLSLVEALFPELLLPLIFAIEGARRPGAIK